MTQTSRGSPEHASWVRVLRDCQEEIASLDPHPGYLKAYRREEDRYWWHVPRWLSEDISRRKVETILDIGCAYGTLLLFGKRLSTCAAYATDFVSGYLSPAVVAKHGIHFRVNNIELDPFPWDRRFDVILFTEVLEHLNFCAVPTLRKIAGLLNADGRLYLSTPDASEWGRVTTYYPSWKDMPLPSEELRSRVVDAHVWQFDDAELQEVTAEAGLEVIQFDYAPGVGGRHFNMVMNVA
jgi:SAM-dependent methyltransferase